MTDFLPEQNLEQIKQFQSTLLNIQRLTVKSFEAQDLKNLIFIILNDTYQVIKYDRSILFSIQDKKVNILGVSGQANFNHQTELASRLKLAVKNLKKDSLPRILNQEDFSDDPENWNNIQSSKPSTVYWVPITADKEELGLWLEKFDDPLAKKTFESYTPLIKELLVPAYAIAWKKMSHSFSQHKVMRYLSLKKIGILSLVLLTLLFLIPVRLRIVAPCEVISEESYVITAPIDGVIEKVVVQPGQEVKKDQILYEYDKKIPTYKYEALLKEEEILQAELNRTYAMGIENDSEEISKLALLDFKLNKSKLDLAFAHQQLALLIGRSPIEGLVSVENADEWRGKPVKTGEKIMTINNPLQTRVKIWIPERDNIKFDYDVPIHIFLNSIPTKTFEAKFLFIAPEVKVGEGELPSFEAEAKWVNIEEHPKLGSKGSAVIYGEKVSLFYYFLRKPIGALRHFIGF